MWLRFPWDILWSEFDGNISGLKWSMRSGQDDRWFHLYSQQGCQRSLVIHPPCAPGRSGGLFPLPFVATLPLSSRPQPCFLAEGSATIIWQVQSWISWYNACTKSRGTFLYVLSLRGLLYLLEWTLLSDSFPAVVMISLLMWFGVPKEPSAQRLLSWGTHIPMRTFNSTVNTCVDNTLKAHSIGVP